MSMLLPLGLSSRDPALQLSDWGYVLESGQGTDTPQEIKEKIVRWTTVANM